MRRKQLFAIILAGALAAGSAPAAVFAAESDMAAMSEEGTGDAGVFCRQHATVADVIRRQAERDRKSVV